MDDALEACSQRIRHHLHRPLAGRKDLLNETAGNTVNETDLACGPGIGARDQPGQMVDQVGPDGGVTHRLFGVVADHEPLRAGTLVAVTCAAGADVDFLEA